MSFSNFAVMGAEYFTITKKNWQVWEDKTFRYKLVGWFIILVSILVYLPFFFQYIEQRNGISLTDPLLDMLTPTDLSVPIFLIIWTSVLLMLLTFIRDANILLNSIAAYCILTIFRLTMIYFIPLEPPIGLIELKDPLSNTFYGASFITKDLFFSGHTSTLFLIFLILDNQKLRMFSLIGTCIVGFLLLLQHVHYTIDVIFAFPFAFISYLLAKKIV